MRSPATKQFDVSAEIRVQAVIIRRRKHGQNLRCHIRDSSLCMRASVHLLPWNCACIRIPPVCTGEIAPADRNRFLPADVSIRRHRKSCRPHADHLESNRCPNEGHSRASQESYNNNNNNNVNSRFLLSFTCFHCPALSACSGLKTETYCSKGSNQIILNFLYAYFVTLQFLYRIYSDFSRYSAVDDEDSLVDQTGQR